MLLCVSCCYIFYFTDLFYFTLFYVIPWIWSFPYIIATYGDGQSEKMKSIHTYTHTRVKRPIGLDPHVSCVQNFSAAGACII